jgi:hypothetical protein
MNLGQVDPSNCRTSFNDITFDDEDASFSRPAVQQGE